MATTQRDSKGSPLTWDEMDANWDIVDTVVTGLADHLADTADAHDASAISNTPAGGIVATTVQAAIDELDTEKAPKAAPTFTGLVTVAGQIAFPAVQSASADANTLDDYEEGTWTPTDGSGAALAITSENARYQKIGKMVYAYIGTLSYPATADGSNAIIGGLPYGSATGGSYRGSAMIALTSGSKQVNGLVVANGTTIPLYEKNDGSAATNAELSGLSIYGWMIMYEAAN